MAIVFVYFADTFILEVLTFPAMSRPLVIVEVVDFKIVGFCVGFVRFYSMITNCFLSDW